MRSTSQMTLALFATVLFGTLVSSLSRSPVKCERRVRSSMKFTLPTA
jgi:hypothetical protein